MKVALLLLAVLGLSNASVLLPERQKVLAHHVASRDLNDLLQQFINFIPFDKCKEIVDKYLATDPDVQAAYKFLLSDEFKSLTDKVVAMPEYQNFLKFLYDAGVDIYTYQNILREMLGLPPIQPPKVRHPTIRESGIITMIKEILGVLPIDDIKKWFYETCLPDPSFQELLEKLTSQEFRDLVEAVHRTPEYNELTDVLRSQGVDVDEIEKVIADFISGSKFVKAGNARSLDDLLEQFAAFIPFSECQTIVERYIATDPDVKQAYDFLMSDDFKQLADKVANMPEYQEFLKYLEDAGLDIYTYQNIIRKMLGLPPIEPPKHHLRLVRESGIIKMVLEILSILPIDEIKDWFYNVCLPDPDFQALIEKMTAPEFQKLVEAVVNSPEYKEMTDILRSQGIDVDAIEKAIEDFFNNHYRRKSARSLESLLQDFIAFIPTDEILNILLTYISEDPDVQRVLAFLQGEDFRNLVIKLEGVQELKDFLNWLVSKNIDAYTYINKVLDLLGIPEIQPKRIPHFRRPSPQSGLTNMIDDILAILPIDEIVSWYKSTCEPDPEFQELLEQLRSDSFQVVVDTVTSDPAFPIMHNGLIDLDVDIVAIEDFLHNFFGW